MREPDIEDREIARDKHGEEGESIRYTYQRLNLATCITRL